MCASPCAKNSAMTTKINLETWSYEGEDTKRRAEECREAIRADLRSGKVSIRWYQDSAGYRVTARGRYVAGLELFGSPKEAVEYVRDNLGLDISNARVIG